MYKLLQITDNLQFRTTYICINYSKLRTTYNFVLHMYNLLQITDNLQFRTTYVKISFRKHLVRDRDRVLESKPCHCS